MKEGIILKALSGFYYVEEKESKRLYTCRSRGLFRKQKITPLVGDDVRFTVEEDQSGYVMEVLERQNELVRPPIANVDCALVVFSVKEPDFNVKLLDRFLTVIEHNHIEPIIILTKSDLLSESEFKAVDEIVQYYREIGYQTVYTSAKEALGLEEVQTVIADRTVVICGQSGVGKSSLLNAMDINLNLEVNEISKALGRGRHTTRHVELHKVGEALLADTPGFSSLDLEQLDVEDLSYTFIEFHERSAQCKFRGCIHDKEPKCAVKEAVETQEFLQSRYDNYQIFLNEIRSRKPKY